MRPRAWEGEGCRNTDACLSHAEEGHGGRENSSRRLGRQDLRGEDRPNLLCPGESPTTPGRRQNRQSEREGADKDDHKLLLREPARDGRGGDGGPGARCKKGFSARGGRGGGR